MFVPSTYQKWSKFHDEGPYDSWAYPSDERGTRGAMHSIFAGDVEAFRKDPLYMNSYLRGLELTMSSWGWDIYLRRVSEYGGENVIGPKYLL